MGARRGSVNAIRNAHTVRTLRLCVPCARLQHSEKRCRACGGPTEGCASKGEARRLRDLALLQKAGHICGLVPHPRYELVVAGVSLGAAVMDASYREVNAQWRLGLKGATIVEDVKGEGALDDELSRLKRGLVKAVHGIEVRLVAPSGKPWSPRKPRRRAKR